MKIKNSKIELGLTQGSGTWSDTNRDHPSPKCT